MQEQPLGASQTSDSRVLIQQLTDIVGKSHILTDARKTERYRKGFRSGQGDALAVVFPGSLLEQWKVFKASVEADKIVLMQAANTGLTEGSTPSGNDYDREIVIISTQRLDKIQLLDEGKQVVALPGSTLWHLERILKPLGREPHSVIGSSCIGASVVGGVCNNSGGSLVHRGPAYTEMALYGRVNELGQVELVNHLGIALGSTPEEILTRLENQKYGPQDVEHSERQASDHDYAERIRDVEADTPSRFNADERRLFEASGCAGKLAVFAVRLDTFPAQSSSQVFYIGTNQPQVLTELRRHMLANFKNLPVAGEYMHRDIFDIAEVYGKDTFVMIDKLGTDKMPMFFTLKGRMDAIFGKVPFLPSHLVDRTMQTLSHLLPSHLPKRLKEYRNRFEHHLMLKMSGEGIEEARAWLESYFAQAEGEFLSARQKREQKHSYIDLPLRARQSAITRCTAKKLKTFLRSILRCAATIMIGSSVCRRNLTMRWCTASIMGISCATFSIRITLLKRRRCACAEGKNARAAGYARRGISCGA